VRRIAWSVASFLVFVVVAAWSLAGRGRSVKATSTPGLPEDFKPYVETIPGTDVKFEMVPIPGGTFKMGSLPTEADRSADEGPQHPVTLRPFWMSKTEVTWDGYDIFAFSQDIFKKQEQGVNLTNQRESEKEADAMTRPTPPYTDETFGFGRKGQPVINITHHAAMEYTRWLSAKTGKIYRLPTEAEWEYACRAGAETAYFFGNDPGQLGEYAWYQENSKERPHPVGQKKPNPWGLLDILGNVAEWCLDRYDKDYYSTFKLDVPTLLPVLLPGKEKFPHVARGGSWDDKPGRARCVARRSSSEDWIIEDPQRPQSIWWLTDALFVGFRIVRPVEERENLKGFRSLVTKYD
jgi:formylglycine-generating enzyme required for sulfatase activity